MSRGDPRQAKQTKLLVQGITGSQGAFHCARLSRYGTNVVAGVTPGKGGEKFDDSIPIYQHRARRGEGHGRERLR